ncbi:hypothetical protein M493_10710 [Geobacillus genomosp. 3]|uniref:Tripartite ATP-independent periplasmic transporters DctQ component domain-containing protein n=1 Tax=Geobacillus genomosp. 3 TaxID=1921421 RepID=S5ZPL5_GEOG3|nr:TRAP transporter small permease [Geobacillus genomosp. 3]AGT32403.1 hypothetical protein M493_10710 [Geobacillus genomosp. 3]
MGKVKKVYSLIEDILAGLFLIVGLCLIVFEVIMRYIFNSPTTWTTEVSTVMVTWGILLGLSVALRDKHHICVDLFYVIVPKSLRKVIDYFAGVIGILFCLFYTIGGTMIVLQTWRTGQLSMETGVPMWIYYMVIPFSGLLLTVRFIGQLNEVRKERMSIHQGDHHLGLGKESLDEYRNAF